MFQGSHIQLSMGSVSIALYFLKRKNVNLTTIECWKIELSRPFDRDILGEHTKEIFKQSFQATGVLESWLSVCCKNFYDKSAPPHAT